MRADLYLTEAGYVPSRSRAQELISKGLVRIDGRVVTKPSFPIREELSHEVEVSDPLRYVGRGGLKLEGALSTFGIKVCGRTAVDIGASTGGFTDCLLQHGAAFVTAVDAGCDQLAPTLKNHPQVRNVEHCNARGLTAEMIGGRVELAVMDVSFISATYVLPRFPLILREGGEAVCLIKPQFEVGPERIGKGGIVKDPRAHRTAILRVLDAAEEAGLTVLGLMPSPIEGGDGNREFLVHLRWTSNRRAQSSDERERMISSVL